MEGYGPPILRSRKRCATYAPSFGTTSVSNSRREACPFLHTVRRQQSRIAIHSALRTGPCTPVNLKSRWTAERPQVPHVPDSRFAPPIPESLRCGNRKRIPSVAIRQASRPVPTTHDELMRPCGAAIGRRWTWVSYSPRCEIHDGEQQYRRPRATPTPRRSVGQNKLCLRLSMPRQRASWGVQRL